MCLSSRGFIQRLRFYTPFICFLSCVSLSDNSPGSAIRFFYLSCFPALLDASCCQTNTLLQCLLQWSSLWRRVTVLFWSLLPQHTSAKERECSSKLFLLVYLTLFSLKLVLRMYRKSIYDVQRLHRGWQKINIIPVFMISGGGVSACRLWDELSENIRPDSVRSPLLSPFQPCSLVSPHSFVHKNNRWSRTDLLHYL